jgi:4-amino-4-deoxy-L-arabinose transferase-like glycosyltransferase
MKLAELSPLTRNLGDAHGRRLVGFLKASLLLAVFAFAYYLRHRYWIMSGGLEASYQTWASKHYFGGIAVVYLSNADLLLQGRVTELSRAYPPGYPALIALAKLLGASDPQSFRLVQIGLDAAAAVAAYGVARGLHLGTIAAFLAAMLYAIAPAWVSTSTPIMAESLLPALTLVALLVLIRVAWSRRPLAWFAVGCGLGMLPLVRPEMTFLFLPLGAWALISTAAIPWRQRATIAVVTLLGFGLPWMAVATVNYVNHRHFFITDNISGYALFSGLGQVPNPHGYFIDDVRAEEHLHSLGMTYRSPESEAYWRRLYWNAWREHPEHVLATIAHRFNMILFEPEMHPPFEALYERIAWAPYLLLVSIAVLIVRRQYAASLLVIGPLCYALATNGLMYTEVRYVRYAHLSYLLAAAISFDALVQGWRAVSRQVRFERALILAGLAALLIAGLCFAYWVARQTIILERPARNAVILQPFASGTVAANDDAAIAIRDWEPDNGTVANRDGYPVIVCSRTTPGYQAKYRIDTAGVAGLEVDFRIRVHGETARVGILLPRWDRFTAARDLPANVTTADRFVGAVHPRQTLIVIATSSTKATEIAVESFRYWPICAALRQEIATSPARRLRNWVFPRPSDWSLAVCPPHARRTSLLHPPDRRPVDRLRPFQRR